MAVDITSADCPRWTRGSRPALPTRGGRLCRFAQTATAAGPHTNTGCRTVALAEVFPNKPGQRIDPGRMAFAFQSTANVEQVLARSRRSTPDDVMFVFRPLYSHIRWNVDLNTILIAGGTLVMLTRCNVPLSVRWR